MYFVLSLKQKTTSVKSSEGYSSRPMTMAGIPIPNRQLSDEYVLFYIIYPKNCSQLVIKVARDIKGEHVALDRTTWSIQSIVTVF